jgi:hypothetical protein
MQPLGVLPQGLHVAVTPGRRGEQPGTDSPKGKIGTIRQLTSADSERVLLAGQVGENGRAASALRRLDAPPHHGPIAVAVHEP